MKTRRGIYKDLKESEFKYNIVIDYKNDNVNLEFYFSSMFYLTKFQDIVFSYFDILKDFRKKFIKKYSFYFEEFDIMYLLSLYTQLEKRGFYVKVNNKFINDINKIKIKLLI